MSGAPAAEGEPTGQAWRSVSRAGAFRDVAGLGGMVGTAGRFVLGAGPYDEAEAPELIVTGAA
ncbi:hypothetical protein ACIOEW_06620 [Streptomyces sp. NPDC087901]|uniref:hypothetical protein n=1 Tax=Streptomyces sp. NPDC087901 TaxID=3365818 RepID=UPI0038117D57